MKLKRFGVFFCLCSPAGAGKTTISELLLSRYSDIELSRLITCTSRNKRPEEVDGDSYHFVSRSAFEAAIEADEFFEWQEIHGNYYGTRQSCLDRAIEAGKDLLLVIDIKGALTFKARYPNHTVVAIVLPPRPEDLKFRLRARATDSETEVTRRLATARDEYHAFLNHQECIDYLIVNDDLPEAVENLYRLVLAERLRWERVKKEEAMRLTTFEGELD